MLSASDWQALWLTARLAGVVTLILLVLGTPIAWWLARSRSRWKAPIGAVVALPLVLPPSVLGFYLLLAMGPDGPLGQLTQALGLPPLPFTFTGLVVASVQIYDHVESLDYGQAHRLAAVMLVFSFVVLLSLYAWRAQPGRRR